MDDVIRRRETRVVRRYERLLAVHLEQWEQSGNRASENPLQDRQERAESSDYGCFRETI
ncbi:MAG: hypothetical protein MZW92_06655 [Comamonadaceae bacterium]|nr:hypothetical protein [Comamonadaceae bacterium]